MTAGRPIVHDRIKLHALLYQKGGRRHVYDGNLRDLSDDSGISYFHLTRILADFVKEGRLRRLARGQHRQQTFLVSDPVLWSGEHSTRENVQAARVALGDPD